MNRAVAPGASIMTSCAAFGTTTWLMFPPPVGADFREQVVEEH